jgi:toxin ParE1/3/4
VRLHFTSRAADELEEVIEYIRERSPQGAKNVRARIRKLTQHVLEHPQSGSLTSSGLRRIATTPYPYLIFYEVLADEVIIVGIRHSARNPSSMPGST